MVNIKGNKVQKVQNGAWMGKAEYIKEQLNNLLDMHVKFNTAGNDGLTSVYYNKQICYIENELVNQFGLTWDKMEEIEMRSYKIA